MGRKHKTPKVEVLRVETTKRVTFTIGQLVEAINIAHPELMIARDAVANSVDCGCIDVLIGDSVQFEWSN